MGLTKNVRFSALCRAGNWTGPVTPCNLAVEYDVSALEGLTYIRVTKTNDQFGFYLYGEQRYLMRLEMIYGSLKQYDVDRNLLKEDTIYLTTGSTSIDKLAMENVAIVRLEITKTQMYRTGPYSGQGMPSPGTETENLYAQPIVIKLDFLDGSYQTLDYLYLCPKRTAIAPITYSEEQVSSRVPTLVKDLSWGTSINYVEAYGIYITRIEGRPASGDKVTVQLLDIEDNVLSSKDVSLEGTTPIYAEWPDPDPASAKLKIILNAQSKVNVYLYPTFSYQFRVD
jgi:hypothetical protein